MNRNTLNFWIDLASFLVLLGLVLTGGIMHFSMPPGTGHTHALFGLGRHDYGQIHFYLAISAAALLAIHVYLHWSWVCAFVGKAVAGSQPGLTARCAAGAALVVALFLLVVGGIWWAGSHVKEIRHGKGGGRGQSGSLLDDRAADDPAAQPGPAAGGRGSGKQGAKP